VSLTQLLMNANKKKALLFNGFIVTALSLTTGIDSSKAQTQNSSEPSSTTVALHVDFNRPFIDLLFKRPDGSPRTARFWVDTGGGGFLFCEPLARDIGLSIGEELRQEGERLAPTTPPKTTIGQMSLNVEGARTFVVLGKKTLNPGVNAEGLFPAHLLRRYHVIFDYPAEKFTLAKPGTIKPRGVRIETPIDPRSGFPRIELQIEGQIYGFLLDTGASYTMISREQLETWLKDKPESANAVGAVGAANMGLGRMESDALMLGLAPVNLGTFQLKGISAVSRPKGTFEQYMSRMLTKPIIGALGGNVLRAFRIEIDYVNNASYFEKTGSLDTDLVMTGLSLFPKEDGTFTISSVVKQNGKALVDGILPGDRLIRIDKLNVNGSTLAAVVNTLRGKPQSEHTLVIERDGKQTTIQVPVARIF
jgi:predicted aspartyl protease